MPYIPNSDRYKSVGTPGQLTFAVCILIDDYFEDHEFNYANASVVIAALDNAKEEFRRRFLNPYERYKLGVNGEAFPVTAKNLRDKGVEPDA